MPPDLPPPGSGLSGPGPSAPAEGGVTIPGYQPVEMLGSAPSFGVWVRAVQVRMDRHVLLKVLGPGLPVAHEYFAREIATVVRFDGDGALRAIDEGTVRGYRYLVVDEAEGIPLTVASVGGEEGWGALTLVAVDLWSRVLAEGLLLLPIPNAAWRRLPAGEFVVADLGWLVPIGSPIPQHSSLPKEIPGNPARPKDAVQTFELAGRAMAATNGGAVPPPWRRAQAALTEVPDDATVEAVIAAFSRAREALAPKKRSHAVHWAIGAILIAVLAVWGTVSFLAEPEGTTPSGRGSGGSGGTVGMNGDPGGGVSIDPVPAPVGPAEIARRQAEERGWVALEGALPGAADETENREFWVLLAEPVRRALAVVETDHPGTRAAATAHHELECDDLVRTLALDEEWTQLRGGFEVELAAGRIAAAESLLEPFRSRFLAEGGQRLLPEVDPAVENLRERLWTRAKKNRRTLDQVATISRMERRFRSGATELGRALHGLFAEDQLWAERERTALLETATRYEAVLRTVDAAVTLAHERARAGDWSAAVSALGSQPGEGEFPELLGRRQDWSERVGRARGFAIEIAAALAEPVRNTTAHAYRLRDGERLRGRIVRVAETEFEVKLAGLRETRTLSLLELADEQRAEFVAEPVTAESQLLLRYLLGDADAITEAETIDPLPGWLVDARLRREREANADLGGWLAEGRNAHADGVAADARAAARSIVRAVPPQLWASERAELEEWCRAYWLGVGPLDAFPGATGEWSPDRNITLVFDFSMEGALDPWVPTGAGRGRRRPVGRAMEVRGSVHLTGAGEADLFEGELEVRTEVVSRVPSAPNVNLVLFARGDGEIARGDLFALGFRPPTQLVARIEGDIPVFLPANICGPLEAAEVGDGSRLSLARVEPRVPKNEKVLLTLRSSALALRFAWEGQFDQVFPVPASRARLGTVEFRTYHSEILVGALEIRGRISTRWWERWAGERVEEDLTPSP